MTHLIGRIIALALLAALALAAQANGQLDTGFGPVASGKATTFFPIDASLQRGATRVVKVLVQADNKTLLISNTPTPFGSQFAGNSQIGITRLNADGSPDTRYGPRGQQLFDAGVDFEVSAVDAALRADGAVLVLGTLFGPFNQSDLAVWAVRPDGSLDPNFASGGLLRIRRGGTPSDLAGAIEPYELSQNRFMIAGAIRDGDSGPRDLMHVVLFASTGQLCGVAECGNVIGGNVGQPNQWYALRIAGNFDVQVADLVAEYLPEANIPLRLRTLVRRGFVNAQGEFDTAVIGTSFPSATPGYGIDTQFGINGLRSVFFSAAPGLRHSTGNRLALQRRGASSRLILVGYAANASDTDPSIGVSVIDTVTGANDPGFRGGAALNFDYTASGIHGDAYAADVLATPDGRILIGGGYEYAGFSFGDAALIRLNADGSFDTSFGNLNLGLPGRMGYGHTLFGSDRDNRLDSMALSADGERVVFGGYAYASNDGSYFGSAMRVRLYAQDLLKDGFE
jgi:uncharacterized delta-60 repeat protein